MNIKSLIIDDNPLNIEILADLLEVAERSGLYSSSVDSLAGSAEDDVEVHSEDTGVWVVPDSQVDVLRNTETKVACLKPRKIILRTTSLVIFTSVREIASSKFVFLDSESLVQDFSGLFSSDGNMAGHLFTSLDTERPDGVSGFALEWLLAGQIFEHFAGFGKSITWFTHAAVNDEFVNFDFSHWVVSLLLVSSAGSLHYCFFQTSWRIN